MSVKTVVITGALSGIGEECCRKFAKAGYNVIFSGKDIKRGEELQNELCLFNTQCHFVLTDVSDERQVENLIKISIRIYGGIDVVINSAGTEGVAARYNKVTIDDFNYVFSTNVLGIMLVMKYALPIMCKERCGSVINISSLTGQTGSPGRSIYSASKHAVNGLTRSVALEVAGRGVRVNAIAPGPVDTDMFDRFVNSDESIKSMYIERMPSKRIITTEEIADIALFIASDAARSIIGQVILVDGGYSV
ncbi:SDR family oxidoreductase [Salmonella enterica subsp. enterica serovar Corvallis]|nr:SDR family oxidoreductase [Salmonella enterica]EBS4506371.1 SDR family NAD(P)-dependent oxidoreductase [Salmonella enterica subsp. enterica serovar Molade]ECC3923542.1 SDR family oxidoreductase [Salmonella enterica subsp. enterica]EBO5739429.1 SDR family NAD(P)-dependent oxidoreductase [Salmonella enterica]EBU6868629.1 SDR family NAD(P)-dependent oxidoreductase [Salmonella enterica subsp. enterica serovar Molade]